MILNCFILRVSSYSIHASRLTVFSSQFRVWCFELSNPHSRVIRSFALRLPRSRQRTSRRIAQDDSQLFGVWSCSVCLPTSAYCSLLTAYFLLPTPLLPTPILLTSYVSRPPAKHRGGQERSWLPCFSFAPSCSLPSAYCILPTFYSTTSYSNFTFSFFSRPSPSPNP